MKLRIFMLAVVLLASSPVFAAGYGESRSMDTDSVHGLSVGAGISSPSTTAGFGENPTAAIYNNRLKVLGEFLSPNDNFSNPGFGGGLFMGNGFVGGGLDLRSYDGGAGSRLNVLGLDLAANIDAIHMALGVSAGYTLNNGGAFAATLGSIFNPFGPFRVGLQVNDFTHSSRSFGAGLAYDPSPWATLALDASVDNSFHGLTLKPALGAHVQMVQAEIGYGFSLDGGYTSWITKGVTAGLGIGLGQNFHFEASYNIQLARIYGGLSAHL
jgi:hypothetical protein